MGAQAGRVHGLIACPIYLFWSAVAAVGILIGALNPRDHLRRVGIASVGTVWGKLMWTTMPGWQRVFVGLEHIGEGPYVVVSNHQSVLDIPAILGLPLPLKLTARPGIFRVRVMGHFLRWSGQISTDTFFEEGAEALAGGISVAVFPEGSRSTDGSLSRFRKGAFKLAAERGVAVLPVAIDGSRWILPKSSFFPVRFVTPVCVAVCEPVWGDDPAVLAEQSKQAIDAMLLRIRATRLIPSTAG